ncbi:glycosyltransferase [Cellulosimicrobium sp. NPDC057862]|uniref:glycosyltransferase n=1 Tax=Cellulosimicrobium sp. NPDC057862 TaxID=3346266 RepID=UPI00366C0A2D
MSDLPRPVPELSVVIPAYDAVETLPTQLEALLAQRPDWPWEVLVADNGSNDATTGLVRSWASTRMPELRLVDASARRGPSAARNLGVAAARGPRIAFCDADDRVGDGWVEAMRRALDEHEFVAGPFEGALLNAGSRSAVSWTAQAHGLTVKPFLPQFVTAGSGNMGVLTAVFEEVGGFDEGARTAEDDDFCLRVQLHGHALEFDPAIVLHVRRRDGLWDVCKQAYSYGGGERRLLHRYAEFVAEAQTSSAETGETPSTGAAAARDRSGAGQGPSRVGRVAAKAAALLRRGGRVAGRAVRKAATVRHPGDLSDVAWRVCWSLGWSLTRVDPATPQVSRSRPRSLQGDLRR